MARSLAANTSLDPSSVLSKAVVRAAEILGLKQTAVAKILGLSTASVSRLYAGQYRLDPSSKEWELATQLIRLYRGLDALMASDENALRSWMINQNNELNAVPTVLIKSISGLVTTVSYVDAYRARV